MYESFFGLKEKPFTLLPDPEFLFLSSKHQRALVMLQYALMNKAGFSVICGDIGAGKTTLIRHLLNEINDDVTVGMISNTHKAFGDLLSWVLEAFGLPSDGKSKAQMHREFTDFLIQQYAANRHTVLIVDEAQNMDEDRLEELRMLSNVNADKNLVLQVILAGQPGLRDMLRKPELTQFAQRISVDYYLDSLSHEETCTYIQHRLDIAGARQQIFTPSACDAVYRYSGGTPRLINMLCDTAMVYAFAEQVKTIDARLIEDVVREQLANGVAPSLKNIPPGVAENISASVDRSQPDAFADAGAQHHVPEEQTASAQNEVAAVAGQQTNEEPATLANDAQRVEEREQATAATEPAPASRVNVQTEARDAGRDVETESVQASTNAQKPETRRTEADSEQQDAEDFDFVTREQHYDHSTSDDAPDYPRATRRDAAYYENLYPVVQYDEKEKKSNSYLILGVAIGMFLTTLLVFAAGYFMFYKNPWTAGSQLAAPAVEPVPSVDAVNAELEKQKALEAVRLEALQKERDAAVAMNRALERERDAALASARAQQEMREAERQAAELMMQQERRTAEEIQRAREQARKAELIAAKARERERLARQQAEQARIDAERARKEKEAAEAEVKPLINQGESVKIVEPPAPVYSDEYEQPQQSASADEPVSSAVEEKPEPGNSEPNKFSANPCNSASAKFLSTCKK